MEVLIQPLRKVIDVEPGTNLRQALHDAPLPMSHSCIAGRCGTCRCRVVEGEVLDGGRAEQFPRDGRGCDVLAPARPIVFSPGQHARLDFGPRLARPNSMAGTPADRLLGFHTRILPGGRASEPVAERMKPGDAVRLSGPLGSAYLRRRHGPGAGPAHRARRGGRRPANAIQVHVGARTACEVCGIDELTALQRSRPARSLNVVVAFGAERRGQRRGLVTEAMARDLGSLDGWAAYLCGSPPMVEAAAVLARRKAISPACMDTQAFYTQLNRTHSQHDRRRR